MEVVEAGLQLHARQKASGGGAEVEGVDMEQRFPSGLYRACTFVSCTVR